MLGKLGFDIAISRLSDKDLQFCKNATETYNQIKQIIWQGDQYRLSNPREAGLASMLFVSADKTKAILFNYLANSRYDQASHRPIAMKGMDQTKKCSI